MLTPMGQTEALGRSGVPQHLRNECMGNGAKLNILRSVQGSLRSVASGINKYIRFCTLTGPTAFPPSSGTIRRRGATFNAGETYGLYINHIRKASILLGHGDAWLTPEIRLIADGLRNAQGESSALHNFITTSDVMRITIDQGCQRNMGAIAYLPYLFSLRGPSETIQLTIANPNEKLLKPSPQEHKAQIGPRAYHNNTAMVIKFRVRKNVRGGRILIRPCLFAMASPPGRTFCPDHGFWSASRGRLTPGAF